MKIGGVVQANQADTKPQVQEEIFRSNKVNFGKSLSKESVSFNPSDRLFTFFNVEKKFKKGQKMKKAHEDKGKLRIEDGRMDKPSEVEPSIFHESKNLGKKTFNNFQVAFLMKDQRT